MLIVHGFMLFHRSPLSFEDGYRSHFHVRQFPMIGGRIPFRKHQFLVGQALPGQQPHHLRKHVLQIIRIRRAPLNFSNIPRYGCTGAAADSLVANGFRIRFTKAEVISRTRSFTSPKPQYHPHLRSFTLLMCSIIRPSVIHSTNAALSPHHFRHLLHQYCKNAVISLARGSENRNAAKIHQLPYGKAQIAFKTAK